MIVIRSRPPLYKLQGRKKTLTVSHDQLKPCHDSSFPLWLQRKRHFLLDTLLIDEVADGDDLGEPEQNFAPDLDASFNPDATLSYMQGMDLDATLLYMPGDDTDSSVLLDMGNDHVLIDNVDDTENISQSAPCHLCPQSTTSRSGRKINLPARFLDCPLRAPALMVIILVYVLYGYCQCWCYLHTCMRVSMAKVFILVYVLYECWCCAGRSSLMVSVWVLLILVYVLFGRCRRGYHAVLKCLGIWTDGVHVSLCIVWMVSVLVLLDVTSWVRVPVLVYKL